MAKKNDADVAELALAVESERLRRDFYLFVQKAWPIVEPVDAYRDNFHVRLVCRKLEQVARGQVRKLLINIPPGCAKSLITSVLWPAWTWTWNPGWRGLFASYAEALAVRDAVRARTLLESDWYQERFVKGPNGPRWRFSEDMNQKAMYTNTSSGLRMSLSVGSKAAGFRGNCVVVDDPINTSDALSKAARDEVIYWWDKVMPSRVHDPDRDAFVIIMQRVHEDDLAGHVIRQGGYEVVCLPAEFEPNHPNRYADDPRKEQGELLFPNLLTAKALGDFRVRLGSDGYAGQYQQHPVAVEGGTFKYTWWRFFRPKKPVGDSPRPRACWDGPPKEQPRFPMVVASVDAAFKDGADNDYVVIQIWGAVGAERYLLDQVRRKMDFVATCAEIVRLHKKWPECRRWLIEDKANGSAIISRLKSVVPGIMPIDPQGGKESRASAVTPQVEAAQVFLPEGAPWLQDLVDEHAAFPRSKFDDQVDATSQALNFLSGADALRFLALVSNI
jgi:predicted phage terminase large subunit-like protein